MQVSGEREDGWRFSGFGLMEAPGTGAGTGTAVAHGGQRSSRYGARYGAATAAVQGTRCIEVR